MKNYFTDKQVEAMHLKFRASTGCPESPLTDGDRANLRFIMNTSVDMAIGAPMAWFVEDKFCSDFTLVTENRQDPAIKEFHTPIVHPLHAVTELP